MRRCPSITLKRSFDIMGRASWHQFQVLTKRSERLLELSRELPWHDNVWMGVSVESNDYVHRVADLTATGARVKFLSIEPLLGPLPDLNLQGVDWVIVGGESGPGARSIEAGWVRAIRDRCVAANVPFFISGEVFSSPERVACSMAVRGTRCRHSISPSYLAGGTAAAATR
jgi:protein gp37